MRIDHVQLAIPRGSEAKCAPFWRIAGFERIEKPVALRARGGLWLRAGVAEVHLGVEEDFAPARKAHPAFVVGDIDGLAKGLAEFGSVVQWDGAFGRRRRFFTADPVGNRIEFMEG